MWIYILWKKHTKNIPVGADNACRKTLRQSFVQYAEMKMKYITGSVRTFRSAHPDLERRWGQGAIESTRSRFARQA